MRLALEPFGHVTLRRDGGALVTESRLTASFPRPPLHVHPGQSERFEVGSGRLRLTVGAAHLVLAAGDAVTVPAGTPHTFAVDGGDPVELRATFDPGDRLEAFFQGLHRLARDGHIDDRGRPRSLAVARFAAEHLDVFRLARAPARLQRVALGVLTGGARAG